MAFVRTGRSCLGVLGALLLLAACGEPVPVDYTKRFPITARAETVRLTMPYGGDADAAPLMALVAGYLDRGHGPLTITAAAGTPQARTAAMSARLVAAGVPASAIRIERNGRDPPNGVTLSYTRYAVTVPTCGDWSAPLQFNPSNTDYPEFGCALQHDIGIMLADPADIVGMRAPEPSDSANTERVIRAYRSGTVTEAKPGAIQDSADQSVATGSTTSASTPVPTATH